MISIGVIEDIEVVREELVHCITDQPDMSVVFEHGSIEALEAQLNGGHNSHCDILLLDIGLPGVSGLNALPMLKERLPETDIIMLTAFDDQRTVLRALCSGAVGYIAKGSPDDALLEGVRTVHSGGSYMSPEIAREIVNHLVGTSAPKAPALISDRQSEILEHLSQGMSYGQIAEQLFISVETVRSHIKKMYRLLQVNNKTEAISLYLKGKL